jgi:hypothetical protein
LPDDFADPTATDSGVELLAWARRGLSLVEPEIFDAAVELSADNALARFPVRRNLVRKLYEYELPIRRVLRQLCWAALLGKCVRAQPYPPPYREDMGPWQENAIRALEDAPAAGEASTCFTIRARLGPPASPPSQIGGFILRLCRIRSALDWERPGAS